ncbi:MAG: LPP20 family lipoprotein [Spirochaetales bacterium]|nr:LPP20 family lipoprotein [Spirochaetales bacterium]
MKKIITVMLIVLAVFGMASCGSEKVSGLPDFVLNPPTADDAFYGVGYGNQSTLQLSKTISMTNARADIARQIETSIQAAVVSYAQESGVDGDTQTISFAESITREITDTTLSGATPERFEQDSDGGVWVLLSYPKQNLMAAAEESFVRNENAAFGEFKAQQALAALDAQLENNPPTSEPVR